MDIGSFLVHIGLLNDSELKEIRTLSSSTGLPIRNAVSLSGQIKEDLLDSVFRLYSVTRTTKLPMNVVQDAVALIRYRGLSVEEALSQAGMTGQILGYSRLGTLLVEANLVSKEQMEDARKTSYETGMPLGRMVVLSGLLPQSTVDLALDLQRRLREQSITKDDALRELRGEAPPISEQPQAPSTVLTAQPARKVRMIDLLMLSGAMTEMDMLDAVETSLKQSRPLADIILESHAVSQDVLTLAAELQSSVEDGNLHIMEATDALHYIATTGGAEGMKDVATELSPMDFGELLTQAQIVTEYDIANAIDVLRHYPSLLGKLLITSGAIDEATFLAALKCHQLLTRKYLSQENAVKALHHAVSTQHTLEDALHELGIYILIT